MAKVLAPSGMRDLLPAEAIRRAYMIGKIREAFERFGFDPIETPAMERIEVLKGKGGEEAEKLMFHVLKRGEELEAALGKGADLADLGLRFDLTVPLARFVASHAGELPKVFKRYHIGPVWRAERAQAGRFREFLQCDVDIIGSRSWACEVEAIQAVSCALFDLGLGPRTGDDPAPAYTIRINDRRILFAAASNAGIAPEKAMGAIAALDKLDRGMDVVRHEMLAREIGQEEGERFVRLLWQEGAAAGNAETLSRLKKDLAGSLGDNAQCLDDLGSILTTVEAIGLPGGQILLHPSLARGLDYYTGPVFEIAYKGLPHSLGGGGRYDHLVGVFLGKEVPACGFSIGLDRLALVLAELGKLPAGSTVAEVFVPVMGQELQAEAMRLAGELRRAGLRVDASVEPGKMGDQIRRAGDRGICVAAIIGPDEVRDATVALRDLRTRQQSACPRAQAAAEIRKVLGNEAPPAQRVDPGA